MTDRTESANPFDFTSATLRIGDGDPIPVSSFHIDMASPFTGSLPSGPLFAGSLADVAFGFKFDLPPESTERWRTLSAHWPVDPAIDDQFNDWQCPACGATWEDVPAGHSWSRGSDGKWTCRTLGIAAAG